MLYADKGHEKRLVDGLTRRRVECFCPMTGTATAPAHRRRVLHPLFSGFVFVSLSSKQFSDLSDSMDVARFMYWRSTPAIIPEHEIREIRSLSDKYPVIRIERIPINGGSMENNRPLQRKDSGTGISVSLPSLGFVLKAEPQAANVQVMSNYMKLKTKAS